MRGFQTIPFELISDLQLDLERLTRLLLDSANSLLEWDMFSGINPIRSNQAGISCPSWYPFSSLLFLSFLSHHPQC